MRRIKNDFRLPRIPKTKKLFVVQGFYGRWEDVTAEDSYKEGKARLKEYRENEGMYPHRMVRRREVNPMFNIFFGGGRK